jgi:hypothetical protein
MEPRWTDREKLFLIENYDQLTRQQMADELGRTFLAVKTMAKTLKLKKSREALQALAKRSNAGQFKKGSQPINTKNDFDISTRIDKSGRVIKFIRTSLGKWEELQRYNWIHAGNEIPKGCCLACKTTDTTNCDPSNWELITQAENLQRNRPKGEAYKLVHEKVIKSRKNQDFKKQLNKENDRKLKSKRRAQRKSLLLHERAEKRAQVKAEQDLINKQKKELKAAEKAQKHAAVLLARKQEVFRRREEKRVAKARVEKKRIERAINDRKVLKTRVINYDELIPVRIDHKTVVYVSPGSDIEAIKAKYKQEPLLSDKHDFLPHAYQF